MVGQTHLPAHNNILTNSTTTRNPCLACYYCIIAYCNIMSNLDKVIYFNTFFNDGAAQCCPVYTYIRTYLHIVFNYHIPNLKNLLINSIIILHKSKTITPYNSPAVYYNIFSDNHIVIYTY